MDHTIAPHDVIVLRATVAGAIADVTVRQEPAEEAADGISDVSRLKDVLTVTLPLIAPSWSGLDARITPLSLDDS